MRLRLNLDGDLVAEAVRVSGIRDLRDLIQEALKVLVQAKQRKSLLDLRGRIEFAPGYDPKQFR